MLCSDVRLEEITVVIFHSAQRKSIRPSEIRLTKGSPLAVLWFRLRNVISLKIMASTCLVLNAGSTLVRSGKMFWY